MSDLGAISSYALAMQNVQMSLLKNAVEAQQQAVEILLNPDNSRVVSPSETLGTNIEHQRLELKHIYKRHRQCTRGNKLKRKNQHISKHCSIIRRTVFFANPAKNKIINKR